MSEEERWAYLVKLDDELLHGGAQVSEWCVWLVRETDTAFARGAFLAAVILAVAGIETHLRAEYMSEGKKKLVALIDATPFPEGLKSDLHVLRRYRNGWVHVDDPMDDQLLLQAPFVVDEALEKMAYLAVSSLRKALYFEQWA